jgi:hypothetical protein
MHSYLRESTNTYEVGVWLINKEGYHQFNIMFTVRNLGSAVSAVNTLNGGAAFDVEATEPD